MAPQPARPGLVRIRREIGGTARVSANVGRLIAKLSSRMTIQVHGDCIGAGIELPAFAGRNHRRARLRFGLPEVAMGLIPGTGGTVSIPRRIGRWRTAWLALSGTTLHAPTVLNLGLIDEIG
jgi:enoyl-CoA hydratase/carnithine racemase